MNMHTCLGTFHNLSEAALKSKKKKSTGSEMRWPQALRPEVSELKDFLHKHAALNSSIIWLWAEDFSCT